MGLSIITREDKDRNLGLQFQFTKATSFSSVTNLWYASENVGKHENHRLSKLNNDRDPVFLYSDIQLNIKTPVLMTTAKRKKGFQQIC